MCQNWRAWEAGRRDRKPRIMSTTDDVLRALPDTPPDGAGRHDGRALAIASWQKIKKLSEQRVLDIDIAELAGVSQNAVIRVRAQMTAWEQDPTLPIPVVRVDTERAFLALPDEAPAHLVRLTLGTGIRRSDYPTVGIRRRLQALAAEGFNFSFLAKEMGKNDRNHIRFIATGEIGTKSGYVSRGLALRVIDVYDRFAGRDPRDFVPRSKFSGVITYTRNIARRNGWAPSHCWDSDTIDDPAAIPEWTGRCGTDSGYKIHQREDIKPVCDACYFAHYGRPRVTRIVK
jgi:hypothetical protein